MKLKTRIIYICCMAVLVASFVSEAFIWVITGKNIENEAIANGYQDCFLIREKIENDITQLKLSADEELNYMIKKYGDDYIIAYKYKDADNESKGAGEIYNNTIFTYKELKALKYNQYDVESNVSEGDKIKYAILSYGGRSYVVYHFETEKSMVIFRLYDITDVQQEKIQLALLMLVITICVTGITMFVLFFVLRREFAPLNRLNEEAGNIARGLYDKRIDIRKKDEIGRLSENFNQMAEAVEQRTRSLEESEQKKTIFMGNLTHELKTPMTAISGYAQTLLTAKLDEEEKQEALQYIYEECKRLERLSKKMMKLLGLSESEDINVKCIPVSHIFEAAKKSCQVILKEKNICFKSVEHGESFFMDEDLMTDVLINLIDNAVKASENGGKISLIAYKNTIKVIDYGKGMPEKELKKILEPFYMIDKSRSRKNGGAGLGLALTATIVEKHNIDMNIESEVGKGTVVTLTFK